MSEITSSAVVTCITGLPGQGKTLYAVAMIFDMSKKLQDGQAIYVHGIPDLAIDGCKVLEDPKEWHRLPVGSVIFIDEAWEHFPQRVSSAKVPEHVEAISTLRHKGMQLYLITQAGSDLDAFVRGRIGRHIHVERILGSQMATVFEWPKLKNPETKSERKAADKRTWSYPKHVYPLYRSSQLHTVGLKIPNKIKFAIAGVSFGVLIAIIGLYQFRKNMHGVDRQGQPASAQQGAGPATSPPGNGPALSMSGPQAKPDYFQDRVPRLTGLPHTAPVYDALNTPTVAPKPVACVKMKDRCNCFTQQGTKLPAMPKELCEQIVQDGYFDDSPGPVQANGPVSPAMPAPAPVQSSRLALSQVTAAMPASPAPNLSVGQP